MSRPLSLPTPPVHASHFTVAGNIQHTLQKYGAAGEEVHFVKMAEKMQPAFLVTAQPANKAKKRNKKGSG